MTLTPAQRTELIRELFTAIYADGQATESFKVLRAYISFFSLGMVEFAHVEKFSYRSKLPRDISLNQLDSLSLEQMLALKTGNTQELPPHTLYTIFKQTVQPWSFEEELSSVAHSRAKFKFTFSI